MNIDPSVIDEVVDVDSQLISDEVEEIGNSAAALISAAAKLVVFGGVVLLFFLTEAVVHAFGIVSRKDLRSEKIHVSRFYARLLVKVVGMEIDYVGEKLDRNKGYLLVSNHLSYLDIFALFSIYPACFITSVEMRNSPLLGWICRATGCLFVERRSRRFLNQEIDEIADELRKGNCVMLFPEGYTSNGSAIARFRRPLFQSAINASCQVASFVINYQAVDGQALNRTNRDKVFWYGDTTFFSHFLTVLKMRSVSVQVQFLGLTPVDTVADVTELASTTHALVSSAFVPV